MIQKKSNSDSPIKDKKEKVGNELYLGLIYPIGTDVDAFQTSLENILREYDYALEPIKISKYLEHEANKNDSPVPTNDEFKRKEILINTGNRLREEKGLNFLAKVGISQLYSTRDEGEGIKSRTAYILNGLKHYEEIDFLRSLYGSSFFLIGLHANEQERINFLSKHKGLSKQKAEDLIKKDQDDRYKYGQQFSKSFHRSDVFIPAFDKKEMEGELKRFIDLIFGHPFHTPSRKEFGMFHAYAASLRSGDLSRQVGAVIANDEGDILSQGANEVPKYKGGQYWSDDENDKRDFVRNFDPNKKQKIKIIDNIKSKIEEDSNISEIVSKNQLDDDKKELVQAIVNCISKSQLKDITEYARAVHAEMAAITTASRLGLNLKNTTMYVTTYPCHNCAKHIISTGITKVVYVEPYPKSLARELHDDAIANSPTEKEGILFEPFIGVSPRRFFDLFSLTLSSGDEVKRSSDGEKIDFEQKKNEQNPRIRIHMKSIIEQEAELAQDTFGLE